MPRGTVITPEVRERVRELRYGDGLTQEETAALVGLGRRTVQRLAPGMPGKVPNARVRRLFLASGLSASEVARRLGWRTPYGPDTSRLRRTLGLRVDRNGLGRVTTRTRIDAETAGRIAEALGHAAWEAEG